MQRIQECIPSNAWEQEKKKNNDEARITCPLCQKYDGVFPVTLEKNQRFKLRYACPHNQKLIDEHLKKHGLVILGQQNQPKDQAEVLAEMRADVEKKLADVLVQIEALIAKKTELESALDSFS